MAFQAALSFLSRRPATASGFDFHSQAYQDQFVFLLLYQFLKKTDPGCYLEIGSGDPILGSNSYFFEKRYGWKGISIDKDESFKDKWRESRQNVLLIEDARHVDYSSLLSPFPKALDYLSLDTDADYDLVLKKIPFHDHAFKIITIEHDFYRFGDLYRQEERNILSPLGYYLFCPDVSLFEDWWIYPPAFPRDVFSLLTSLDLRKMAHNEILSQLLNTNQVKSDPT